MKYPLDKATLVGCGFDNIEYTNGVPDVSVNREDNGQDVVWLISAQLVLPTWDDAVFIGIAITPLLLCAITLSADVSTLNMFDVVASAFDIVEMLVERIGVAFDSANTEVVRVLSCDACEVIALDWLTTNTFRLLNETGDIYYKSTFNKSAPKYHHYHQQ